MALVVTVCFAAFQQLQVTPVPAEVGQEVVVQAQQDGRPVAGLQVTMAGPEGTSQSVGVTSREGAVRFVPVAPGQYVFTAQMDGVRVLAPHSVVPRRRWWLLAIGCVPLGLALLWRNLLWSDLSRARVRRGS